MEKGKFITFEGGEGSGKTTQIELLYQKLINNGINVVKTREPGGTVIGEEIRNILVKGPTKNITPFTELLLNSASRKEHIERLIKPNIDDGSWVLCDRFVDSTLVYQGYGHGLDINIVKNINQFTVGDYIPDLTIIFDIDPNDGLTRASKRKIEEDRYEKMDISFHLKIRESYLQIAKNDTKKYKIVDASLDKEIISDNIYKIISDLFKINR